MKLYRAIVASKKTRLELVTIAESEDAARATFAADIEDRNNDLYEFEIDAAYGTAKREDYVYALVTVSAVGVLETKREEL